MFLEKKKVNDDKQLLVKKLFTNKTTNIYILGRNTSAKKLAKVISYDGFIDDYTDETIYLNKPIVKSNFIDKDAIVISCSLAIYPHSAIKSLQKQGIKNILNYLEVMMYAQNTNLTMPFLDDAYNDLQINRDKYDYIYSRLSDDKSKAVFTNILNFRSTKDLTYMKNYIVDPIGQYFEDFLDLQKDEVFIDAGGYDGQTSLEFIKLSPDYKAIYIFEPSEENLKLAKENLKSYKNVNFISKGLSNKEETLKFDTNSGSASSISLEGSVEIHVDTLDSIVDEKVTFVKMDIEGAEALALEGMKQHIINDHPKLAISVYHKADDFWKIPKQILAIHDDYNLYIRHYTEGTDETVMFFIPQK